MNKLSTAKRVQVVAALVEGVSINATVRMTGVSKPTILKLLKDLGCACAAYHNDHVRGLKPTSVQCDEVWAFCYSKQKNVPADLRGQFGFGDVWTWTALDRESKLIISYHLGLRTPADAGEFMMDLAGRINNITQITTDGLGSYPEAIREAFGEFVDYAQIIKVFKAERPEHARYSPASCIGCDKKWIQGEINSDLVSTSHVERSNLTIRMQMRRFTRLTNGHSKKVENHGHALALFFAFYNFCRKHTSLDGQTPAMVAGIADHVWTLEELIGLLG
ncbi:MAG: hypothetical protein AMXMBFR13_16100 [Phycisphaerae bacterium]